MKIKEIALKDLTPYENNPRINDGAVESVKKSIVEFGFKVPLVIDKNLVVVAGHTRLKALKKLYPATFKVPCVIADDLTEEQIKAYRLADNKVSESSIWDDELLNEELAKVGDIDMSQFGFEDIVPFEENYPEELNKYTEKVDIPGYEAKEENPPDITELFDTSKRDTLISDIENADIPNDVKEFLKLASCRHTVFNYKRIAEYYCHAPKEVQRLMEDSALVIIDLNDAIKNGYARLANTLKDLEIQEGDNEE